MYYITSQLSPHRYSTPEGFLVCKDVPIARTGLLEYLPEEVGLDPVEPGQLQEH